MELPIQPTDQVLLVWGGQSPELITAFVEKIQQTLTTGRVQVENAGRLTTSSHGSSSFDAVLSGVSCGSVVHDVELLAEMCRILRPSGLLVIRDSVQAVGNDTTMTRSAEKLTSLLKLSGFVDLSQVKPVADNGQKMKTDGKLTTVQMTGRKPAYEVGSSSQLKLSFAPKSTAPKAEVAQVWSLSGDDIMEGDLLDSDDLLDDTDLKKPDPASLKAECGPGKKKACKNCTCGFAEELDTGKQSSTKQTTTSSCGSCYLGDAFRCASCPYLGMPAFKPGEKVSLTNRQLKADA